ncbi:MAG: hypothetical protein IT291_03045 [Deltaproteobacteria bacterium]|nr:hypothetical protein [Deltaproteobacteria bacterium]
MKITSQGMIRAIILDSDVKDIKDLFAFLAEINRETQIGLSINDVYKWVNVIDGNNLLAALKEVARQIVKKQNVSRRDRRNMFFALLNKEHRKLHSPEKIARAILMEIDRAYCTEKEDED